MAKEIKGSDNMETFMSEYGTTTNIISDNYQMKFIKSFPRIMRKYIIFTSTADLNDQK